MKDRLDMFLKLENLTPAKFAATIGIERSGLSHLLSGRNKPSFDFITKMLAAYPRLNPEWLLLGKGKVYKDDSTPASPSEQTPVQTRDTLFSQPDNELPDTTIADNSPKTLEPDLFEIDTEPTEKVAFMRTPVEPEPSENPKFEHQRPVDLGISQSDDSSIISKIIILFKDGSYEIR